MVSFSLFVFCRALEAFEICDKTYLYRFLAIKKDIDRETQYVYVSCCSKNNLNEKSN